MEFNRISLNLDTDERIGAIAPHDESIIVSLYRKKPDKIRGLQPRVVRLTSSGKEMWSQTLPVGKLENPGVVHISPASGGKPKMMPGWTPRSWLSVGDDQLIISGDRVLASFKEMPGSGIGRSYVLSMMTGQLLWKSKTLPLANVTALSDGKFLLGVQGYGAFETHLYQGAEGEMLTWNSHGRDFVTREGEIMSVQMTNDMSIAQRLVELRSNGSVVAHSGRLPGYYTSKPVQLFDGSVFFWRGDQLWAWNRNQGLRNETEIGFGKGYAISHQLTERKFALNIRHDYGNPLKSERIWAIFDY